LRRQGSRLRARRDCHLGLGYASLGCVSLCQREWNRADSQQQKHVKRASDKMSLNVGVNLFFHRGA
jgi:hypothetical protein